MTEHDLIEIRELYRNGLTTYDIEKRTGLSEAAIYNAIIGSRAEIIRQYEK
jgi:hypothetical protein